MECKTYKNDLVMKMSNVKKIKQKRCSLMDMKTDKYAAFNCLQKHSSQLKQATT